MTETTMKEFYSAMGISNEVMTFGEQILADLEERFRQIDETAEYNQLKVLSAMQKNRVSEMHPVKFTLEISKLLFVSCFSGGRAPQKNQLAIERYSNGVIAFNFLCKRLLL